MSLSTCIIHERKAIFEMTCDSGSSEMPGVPNAVFLEWSDTIDDSIFFISQVIHNDMRGVPAVLSCFFKSTMRNV